jgi:hypothetical protein
MFHQKTSMPDFWIKERRFSSFKTTSQLLEVIRPRYMVLQFSHRQRLTLHTGNNLGTGILLTLEGLDINLGSDVSALQSSGGGSVEAHFLYPSNMSLFRAGIADSPTGPLSVKSSTSFTLFTSSLIRRFTITAKTPRLQASSINLENHMPLYFPRRVALPDLLLSYVYRMFRLR